MRKTIKRLSANQVGKDWLVKEELVQITALSKVSAITALVVVSPSSQESLAR